MSTPTLYIFAISHYCEKARWALEYLGVDFKLRSIAPGIHARLQKKYGLESSSLPLLVAGNEVVHGSAAIIDWAEARATNGRTLTPQGLEADCRAVEGRLDDIAGVHTRRYFYCEALLEHPGEVKPAFLEGLPLLERLLLHVMWPRITPIMAERMDLGKEQGEQSRAIVDDELGWLESLLDGGRSYLVGDSFTRADLTAASLFGRLSGTTDQPRATEPFLPPRMAADQQAWRERPALVWVREIYARHRK
ncbi:MAG: glutathione S-transferase [Halioglobus sp.]|nr:glutathione S-transferase [Halioglobus sp.]